MNNPVLRNAILVASLIPAGISMPALAQKKAAIEEIVVTSQRREQSLQEVPISITAFSEDAIEKFRITNLTDLGTAVPNLSAVEGSGGTRGVVYQIRGLYATGTALGSDSGVATYLDGVYLKGGSSAIVGYADIERIEVLRGPQGTLFGRNTSGGAINFITRNPPGEFGFLQKFTSGNYNHFMSKTRIDTPQLGPVSASLTYVHSRRDGPTKNSGAGATYDLTAFGGGIETSPKRLGDEETDAYFLAVKLDLLENLDLVYKFDYNETDATPPAIGIEWVNPAYGPGFAFIAAPSFTLTTPDEVNNAFHVPTYQDSEGHSLTAEYALTDEITLRNIAAYHEGHVEVPGQTLDGIGYTAPAVTVYQVTGEQQKDEISDEFQVIWDTDMFTWTTGYLYYASHQKAGGYKTTRNAVFGGQGANSIFPGTIMGQQSKVQIESNAVYSQFEYHFNKEWDFILGGRFTNDKKDYIDRTLAAVPGYGVLTLNYDKDETTYLVGTNYKMTDDIMLFAKYSTGYISGGLVSGLAYDAEKAKSIELGAKATWLDGSLQTNIALYHAKYEGQQFGTAGTLVTPPVPAAQVIVNAGDTKAQGFELETLWVPGGNLQLGLNLGYLNFSFDSINFDLTGDIAPHLRPKWTGTITADWESEPLFGEATLQLHLDSSFRSEEYNCTRPIPNTDVDVNDATWRLNAQVALADIKVAGGRVTIAAWGRNLTDEDKPQNINFLGPLAAGQYEFPRTYGVDLTFQY